jgi:hypothetical protein
VKATDVFLLTAEPATALERKLQSALRKAHEKNTNQKHQMVALQSALVLNGAYVDVVRGHWQHRRRKKVVVIRRATSLAMGSHGC